MDDKSGLDQEEETRLPASEWLRDLPKSAKILGVFFPGDPGYEKMAGYRRIGPKANRNPKPQRKDISTRDLLKEHAETLADIQLCKKALRLGITETEIVPSVKDRLDLNKRILKAISEEIERRKEEE